MVCSHKMLFNFRSLFHVRNHKYLKYIKTRIACFYFHLSSDYYTISFTIESFHSKEIGFFSFASLGTYSCSVTKWHVINCVGKGSRSAGTKIHVKFEDITAVLLKFQVALCCLVSDCVFLDSFTANMKALRCFETSAAAYVNTQRHASQNIIILSYHLLGTNACFQIRSSNLKKDAASFSRMLVPVFQTTRRHIQ
jgi:hypothetical protein